MDIDIAPIEQAPEVTRVSIDGRIDAYTIERVDEELKSLIRIGSSKIVCNLSAVEFVAGPGLKSLLRAMQDARKHMGDLKICGLRPEVQRVFELAGFAKFAKLHPNEASALHDFGYGIDSPESEQTLIAGDGALDQTLIAPSKKSTDAIGYDQTMIPSPVGGSEDIGFDQTMVQPSAGGMDAELRAKLAKASKAPAPGKSESGVLEALRKRLQATQPPPAAPTPEAIPADAEQTLLEQIDRIDETLDQSIPEASPPAAASDAPSEPAAADVLQAPVGALLEPRIQPVVLHLPKRASTLAALSQLIGALGTLGGVSTMSMVKFGVAVVEVCRACMNGLPEDGGVAIEALAGNKSVTIHFAVPVTNLPLYELLRPKMQSSITTADAAEAWLTNAADEVEITPTPGGTLIKIRKG